MQNARLDESQAGIKIARRNFNNLRYADDTILKAESVEELKSLLIRVKHESEKADLKFNIQTFLDSKMTADGDCSQEIKRLLLLGRKAMTNLDSNSTLQSRDIAADKGPYSLSYGFSSSLVWICELDHREGWMLKNWCSWIVVLEKTLESPWDKKELKPVNPKGNQLCKECCWSWTCNTLAIWCRGLTHWKRLWCWKRLKANAEVVVENEMVDNITDLMDMNLSKLQETVKDGEG